MSPIKNLTATIWTRVRSESAAEIADCSVALKEHRSLVEEYTRRSLLPGQAEAMLKKLSEESLQDPTAERLEAHALILSKLRAIAENLTVQGNARRAVNAKFMEAEPAILAMEKAVAASLDRQTAELVEAERAFFAGYGLPQEQTAVSRLAVSLKESIHNHSFTNGKSQIMGMGGGASDWVPRFDISSLRMLFADETADKPLAPVK
jgi:hypothetical protein